MEWKDSTSYSKGDKERKQTAWTYQNDLLRITVTNNHRDYPGKWIMHCFAIGINTKPVSLVTDEATPEQAQKAAFELVKYKIECMLNSIS
jgi:hypothetical protein